MKLSIHHGSTNSIDFGIQLGSIPYLANVSNFGKDIICCTITTFTPGQITLFNIIIRCNKNSI